MECKGGGRGNWIVNSCVVMIVEGTNFFHHNHSYKKENNNLSFLILSCMERDTCIRRTTNKKMYTPMFLKIEL